MIVRIESLSNPSTESGFNYRQVSKTFISIEAAVQPTWSLNKPKDCGAAGRSEVNIQADQPYTK